MKKLSVIAGLLLVFASFLNAQHTIYPFLDDKGAVRLETTELNDAADTLVSVFHRADDIQWRRVVYRVIDMRYKQNYGLYYPNKSDDPEYKSLFQVIVEGLADGLPIYRKRQDDIKPEFSEETLIPRDGSISRLLTLDDFLEDSEDPCYGNPACSDQMLLNYDSLTQTFTTQYYAYDNFVLNQLKYLTQEVVFFDRHNSRLYSKIIAIAPLHAEKITKDSTDVVGAMHESILFWIAFDDLRPYLARQYMRADFNDGKRITYDQFFAQKLYTSYLLGDNNIYGRMISRYARSEEETKREQQRIADELLNFEQDLWEY